MEKLSSIQYLFQLLCRAPLEQVQESKKPSVTPTKKPDSLKEAAELSRLELERGQARMANSPREQALLEQQRELQKQWQDGQPEAPKPSLSEQIEQRRNEESQSWQAKAKRAKAELEKKYEGYSPETRTHIEDMIKSRMNEIADQLNDLSSIGELSGKGKKIEDIEYMNYGAVERKDQGFGNMRVLSPNDFPEIYDLGYSPGEIRDIILKGKETSRYMEIKKRVTESMLDDPYEHFSRLYGREEADRYVGDRTPREFWEQEAQKAKMPSDVYYTGDDIPF